MSVRALTKLIGATALALAMLLPFASAPTIARANTPTAAPTGPRTFTAEQHSRGGLTTSDSVQVTAVDPVIPPITLTNPANASDGYTANRPFTYEGVSTADSGATVTVENLKHLVLGTTKVEADGTWKFTWQNMRTSLWSLDFVAEKGQPSEASAPLRGFSPISSAVTPIVITNPKSASDGYDADKPFSFRGTARANSTVTVQNVKGLVLATGITTDARGAWTWTYANMKTTTWSLDFIADKGTVDETTAQLRGFAPID